MPQHPTVLAGTVLDNITLGRPGIDERIARAALEAVQLGPWLRFMPHGLRTLLSGLDAPLSLGERRRLAVARSLAGPCPRLWLLDEPTAGLDRAGAVPVLAAAAAWCAAVVTAAVLLPAAGWAILAAGVLATAGVTITVILADRKTAALPAARAAVGSWVLGSLTSAEELAALGAGEWALAELAERERVLGARTRAVAAAVGLGRGACVLAGAPGWPGSPGRARRPCGPGGSAPLSSASWPSWP